MLTILALSNMYPPHAYGGYELMCADVVDRFRRRGHRVEVLTTDMRISGIADPNDERSAGVRRDLRFYWDDHRIVRPSLRTRYAIERANQRALLEALDDLKPDVVSLWNMGAMSLGLIDTIARLGIPIVFVVCDDWLFYGPNLDAWSRLFVGRLGRLAAPVAHRLTGLPTGMPDVDAAGAVCFTSEHTRQLALAKTRWTFPRSTVMYSGIDLDDFPLDRSTRHDEFKWRLLYVGRIDPRKGIETLLRCLPLLPDKARASIVGSGDEAELARLRSIAAELGICDRVSFGSLDRRDLRAMYEQADVVVFPSTWAEPFGLVPVEAMASGTPVLGTGTGGSNEFLIDGFNCLRFRPSDHEMLGAQIERLANDEPLRRELLQGGLATARELTVDRVADVLEQWHMAAANGFANGVPADRPLTLRSATDWPAREATDHASGCPEGDL